MTLETLALQGHSTVSRSMASAIGNKVSEMRKALIKESFSDFRHMEHRMEYVANIHGIEFVNDSRATNVNSTWYALETMTKPVIWIAGGVDHCNDFECLIPMIQEKVRTIILLGQNNERLLETLRPLEKPITECMTMEEAVETAYDKGRSGEVVLLSPACASFDIFVDFEERGKAFKDAVRKL
ncbi:MAG: cyanophycin synthetase [Bacteroidota bacterium]|nr:cyanophycin synthetase [Bacteroidota bacterium]